MCRSEANLPIMVWLFRGSAILLSLQFAAFSQASCGHYVVTKIDLMAARASFDLGMEANSSPAGRLLLDVDRMRSSPRFSAKKQPSNSPCHGPGCRHLPDTWSVSPVVPNPVRANGVEMVTAMAALEIPCSNGGFDSAIEDQVTIIRFASYLFRPPRF